MLSEDYPVGSLVLRNHILARIRGYHGDYLPYRYLHDGSGGECWKGEGLIMIAKTKITPDPKVPSLKERRDNLFINLNRTMQKVRNEDRHYPLISQFHRYLSGDLTSRSHRWWWLTVAEALTDPRKISFAAEMAEADNDRRRRFCSIKKFCQIATRYGSRFTEEEAETLGHLIGNHFPDSNTYTFDVVRGEDAVRAYRDSDPAWQSCMARSNGVRWYARNPDKVGVVKIMRGKNLYMGRALIWTCDGGETVVDRVYPSNNGPHTAALHRWCEEHGYDYKTRQCMDDGLLKSKRLNYHITMQNTAGNDWEREEHGYPYLDTMKYAEESPRYCDTITLTPSHGDVRFDSTGGSWSGTGSRRPHAATAPPTVACLACSLRVFEEAVYYNIAGEPFCEDCYHEHYVEIQRMGPYGRMWEEARREDAFRCAHCLGWFNREDGESIDGSTYCPTCLARIAQNCSRCGALKLLAALNQLKGYQGAYCDDCAHPCPHCHRDIPTGHACLCDLENKENNPHEPPQPPSPPAEPRDAAHTPTVALGLSWQSATSG